MIPEGFFFKILFVYTVFLTPEDTVGIPQEHMAQHGPYATYEACMEGGEIAVENYLNFDRISDDIGNLTVVDIECIKLTDEATREEGSQ